MTDVPALLFAQRTLSRREPLSMAFPAGKEWSRRASPAPTFVAVRRRLNEDIPKPASTPHRGPPRATRRRLNSTAAGLARSVPQSRQTRDPIHQDAAAFPDKLELVSGWSRICKG